MAKEQLSTYQVNLALHMDHHEHLSTQLSKDLKEMEKQMEKQCEAIRKEERIKQNHI
jgi:fructose/tagatose bisphosphate aldolase